MSWTVALSKKALKQAKKLPAKERQTLTLLESELLHGGPVRGDWHNYSKLADGSHHCHLSYRYVAVWKDHGNNHLEIIYVGTREGAPY